MDTHAQPAPGGVASSTTRPAAPRPHAASPDQPPGPPAAPTGHSPAQPRTSPAPSRARGPLEPGHVPAPTASGAAPSADDMLLAAFARCLTESTHTAASGVRRVAAELVRDLRNALLTEHSDAARVVQTYVALHAVMRAWPARSSERLLLRAIGARFQIPVGRSAPRKSVVGGR